MSNDKETIVGIVGGNGIVAGAMYSAMLSNTQTTAQMPLVNIVDDEPDRGIEITNIRIKAPLAMADISGIGVRPYTKNRKPAGLKLGSYRFKSKKK